MTVQLNDSQLKTARSIIANAQSWSAYGQTYAGRNPLSTTQLSTKHDFDYDFGYKAQLKFSDLYQLYKRNGVANGVVSKTIIKTWETMPSLTEDGGETEITPREQAVGEMFDRVRFWQQLMETDKRSLVGQFSGVIFQLADNKQFSDPVDTVPGGLNGLINLIPAWAGQLTVSEWDQDEKSQTYGEPLMMTFTEASVDADRGKTRAFQVHPDRVYIWSPDRTTYNDSQLEPTYNAMIDMVKLRGAGAEGFWKNTKSQPVLEADPEVNFQQLAQMLGTDIGGLPDALDRVVADWSTGFDQSLILQGMTAKTLGVTLPGDTKEIYDIAAQEVSASWNMPQKVLFGNQTGERASTEDASAWNRHNMSRRNNIVIPNIKDVVSRLVKFGVLPDLEWVIDWQDLTGATDEEMFRGAKDMADINQKMAGTGEVVFSDDEIRGRVNMEPKDEDALSEFDDEPGDDEDGFPDGDE